MSTFRLPDLGEGLADAEIVRWHVQVGDEVLVDQPLVSVETAKAVVEVPAPRAGTIAALHGAAGERIETGAPLVEYADADDADGGSKRRRRRGRRTSAVPRPRSRRRPR